MNARIDRVAWPLAVALAWLWACVHLSAEWRANGQYQFCFGVPFLAAWMAWKRRGGAIEPGAANFGFWSLLIFALTVLALGTLLHWHDPLWRFTGALLAFGAVLLTGAWFHRTGGSPLLRREIFPLCFSLLVVPWPVPVENWIALRLTGAVTGAATMIVNAFGIAALQRGNTIELSNGILGMDEACSGIQSFQAMLMASLFLGECFTLPVARRAALVLGGLAISFATNCIRVVALTLLAGAHGKGAAESWHDFIGGGVTLLAFALLLAFAYLLSVRGEQQSAESVPAWPVVGIEGRFVCFAVLVIPVAGSAWFSGIQKSSGDSAGRPRWALSDRALPAGWSSQALPPAGPVRDSLRFSEWQSLGVRGPDGSVAQVIRMAWKRGERLPSLVTTHTPAMCMPSVGWAQSAEPSLLVLDVHGAELPCVAWSFTRDNDRLLVLQSQLAGERPELRQLAEIPGGLRRLSTLWQAPLRQITEELLLYIPDPGDAAARKMVASEFLSKVLVSGSL